MRSPYTNSQAVELIKTFSPSLTSDGKIVDEIVENWFCLDTGITFSNSRIRGSEKSFYMDEYELSSESAEAEIIFFDQNNGHGMYNSIVDFILGSCPMEKNGRILDVGCGKGLLLRALQARCSDWRFSGIEPSVNAIAYFKKVMPDLEVFEGMLEDSPFLNEKFNLVVSNGVLEHVPDPLRFLRSLRSLISGGGMLFLGVPNFRNNPFDVFTIDHLSRFSPINLEVLFRRAGLKVQNSKITDTRVPMWYLLSSVSEEDVDFSDEIVESGREVVLSAVQTVERFFSNFEMAVASSRRDGRPISVYGTSGIAMMGTRYTSLKETEILRFFDDNHTQWGHKKLGIPICSPELLKEGREGHIVLSASPCYVKNIFEKIGRLNPRVKVYAEGLI